MATSPFDPAQRSTSGAPRTRRGARVNDPLPAGQSPLGNKRLKGRYKLGAILGQGSLGMTYRAEDILLQRAVAVKMLADRYADDSVFRERFMAATAAAGRLIHPNIATVLDAGVADGHPFVVMELVEGQSLRSRLSDRGPMSVQDCQRLALQLTEALAVAHRQRVIHGDIRPENVLLDEDGNAKLTDFGFVRAAVATDVTLLGTVQRAAYSPPELAIRDSGDEPTDVYALAVVVYEMLTGTTPRAATGAQDRATQTGPIPVRRRRPDVPAHLDRAIWRAIEPEPRERISTAVELRAALSGRDTASVVAAGPPPTPPPMQAAWRAEPRQRQRSSGPSSGIMMTLLPLLATALLIAAAVGGIMFFIPRLFDGFRMTDTPALVGRTMQEAMGEAERVGLSVKASESVPTDDQPKGTVLSQDPPADRRTRRGTEIKITISAGIRPPAVLGKPVDEARVMLVRAGWNVTGVETRSDLPGAAGTVVSTKPGAQELADDRKQGILLYVGTGNLAAGRAVRFEGGGPGPTEMIDGKVETAGFLNKAAPTWIEIDLAQPGPLTAVELVTAQDQSSVTIHEIWVWTTDGQFRGMHTFVGPTSDGQTLTTRFDSVPNARAVRIATTQATGRTGWREIKLLDR
ncbi:MAG TPA: protein kinase [Chloroflexota bacterium]|nr:protein kinase [Chloroflexota bacterium]